MKISSVDFHTSGRLSMVVKSSGTTVWVVVNDQHDHGVVPCFFSTLPEHVLRDACGAFNKVISDAMEGIDHE